MFTTPLIRGVNCDVLQSEQGAASEEAQAAGEMDIPKPELLVKHPLQNRWALWFFKNDKSKDWAANLKQITAFDTVEDFWA